METSFRDQMHFSAVILSRGPEWNTVKALVFTQDSSDVFTKDIKLSLPESDFKALASEELLASWMDKLLLPRDDRYTKLRLNILSENAPKGELTAEAWFCFNKKYISLSRMLFYSMLLKTDDKFELERAASGDTWIIIGDSKGLLNRMLTRGDLPKALKAPTQEAQQINAKWIQKVVNSPNFRRGALRRRARRMHLLHGSQDTLTSRDLSILASRAAKTPGKRDDRQVQFAKNVRRH